ncbi:sigma-70 family RNA polymerase sigma factor [Silicimonas algicola]|uniref:RNA polymerase sigma factor n=1 Tax=Silicimonas algicola TaxID=1826607 RepID=A0A316G924_9RHOB|nr:sigma-70 family RNA polymerase sigma factor [Silicimonas algicola]AZQ67391.1 sigma-70 family RNA polymerase sigma factor [Silicimonas algicola]PWK57073.1 RNA polymerase sigma-70 factor (ECF subfamily) [Silicimonas algicola]
MRPDTSREDVVEHLVAMRAFAHSLCPNRAVADDIVQDAVVKAWTNFGKYRPGTNLRAWLFTITRNTYYSHLRKARHRFEDIDGPLAAALATRPDHDGRLDLDDVMAAVASLSVEQREALLLVGSSGFSYEEAAEMCGISLGTLKSRISRGRKALSEVMETGVSEVVQIGGAVTCRIVDRRGPLAR